MTTLYVTRGLPGAGKTTWAKEFVAVDPENRVRVNRDDLRMMMYGVKTGLTFQQEELITLASKGLVEKALKDGRTVVVDDMNLRPKYVREWYKVALECGADDVFLSYHKADIDELMVRNKFRPESDRLPENALLTLYSKYMPKGRFLPVESYQDFKNKPTDKPDYIPYKVNPEGAELAVIIDIDGTMAHNKSGRGWFDWSRVGEDSLNENLAQIAQMLHDQDVAVIYLSGRDEVCRPQTESWLKSHGLSGELYMRTKDDNRADTIVKYELFDKYIRDKYEVLAVIDDRPSVCRMWREIGLNVMQVGNPDFEF